MHHLAHARKQLVCKIYVPVALVPFELTVQLSHVQHQSSRDVIRIMHRLFHVLAMHPHSIGASLKAVSNML